MLALRCSIALALALPGAMLAAPVDFNREVRPIISEKCFHCHGPDEGSRKAKLRLDIRDEALKERDGVRAIVPKRPEESELMIRVESKDPDEVMPPPKEHHEISAAEIDALRRWISEGAPYAPHWSFSKVVRPAAPNPENGQRTAIDGFIAAELKKTGLGFSPEADRHSQIRRLSLDLTGLPPTSAEVAGFVNDSSPDYYERAVDRLLASPHYGERWARMWLDCARYADSTGYGSDKLRPFVWPWRDWVIRSFNQNKPYDQFTIEQLAGDLLPNATRDQVLATTFNRNTMTNVEGGTIDEEYRVAAIKDRVATTMQVWMGLTAGCAQCHTHKFDPISQKDYYSMFAVFNQTEDSDREDEEPRFALPTPDEEKKTAEISGRIAGLEKQLAEIGPELEVELHEWEAQMHRPVTWTPLLVSSVKSESGATLNVQPDGSILASGSSPETERYVLTGTSALRDISALRLEVLPDGTLPSKGPGRAANGNVVVSGLNLTIRPAQVVAPRARFLRIELAGDQRILALAEVQVISQAINVATQGKATQSTTDFEGEAGRAIDGKTDGHYFNGKSVTHTAQSRDSWWEVDLGDEKAIDQVLVWNRTDSNPERLKGAQIILLDAFRAEIGRETIASTSQPQLGPFFGAAKPVRLVNASADFAQASFDPAQALDRGAKTGWALAGATGQAHAMVAEFASAIEVQPGSEIAISLSQQYGTQHTLGRFRLSFTSAPTPVRELPGEIRSILAIEPSERDAAQRDQLVKYFRPLSKHFAKLDRELASARKELKAIEPVRVPIMRELASDKHRKTYVLTKGNYLLHGDEVQPALFQQFHPTPAGQADRLALAKWIINPENPLTARVAVNRFWSQLFGSGLVESEEDFGTQGQLPSHPELLDWLAAEFQDTGWNVKRLLRLIVTSTVYRQSSRTTPELLQKDPRCRLLSRYPRRRLGAEEVRDQALAVSGLLSLKIGGPSVYPPQPEGLWNVAFNGASRSEYKVSMGEDRWRRGLYTVWRRTMPNPTMITFDAPSRETCTLRRVPTNTPLQAFVTLNDPVFVECAQSLARRIMKEGGADTDGRIRFGLELCLGRPADAKQIAILRQLFDDEILNYRQLLDAARKLATEPLGALPEGLDVTEAAAWTSVANVLLNLDGVLAKN